MFAFFMVVISASIFSIFITEAAKKLDRTTKVKIYNSKVRKYRDNKLVVDLKEKVEMQGLAGSYSLACVILVDKDYEDIEVNRDIKNTSSNMN